MHLSFKDNIVPVWQPVGHSTYRITTQIACKYGKKATHTGVLDPMAEGVVVILLGEERLRKQELTATNKGYEFTVTFGISTDSYDGMGLTTATDFSRLPSRKELERVIAGFIGEYEQEVPLYSARKVGGKKLFMYPKLGLKIPILPKKSGTIYSLKLIGYDNRVKVKDRLGEMVKRVKNIDIGEFRQPEIVSNWEHYLNEIDDKFTTEAKFYAEVSRGMYIRSLSQDICRTAGVLGFVSSLVRVKNGPYTKENSYSLKDILS